MKTVNQTLVLVFIVLSVAVFSSFQTPVKINEKLLMGTWKETKDRYVVFNNGKQVEQREYPPDSRNKYNFMPGGKLELSMYDAGINKIVKVTTTWKIDLKTSKITCGAWRISPALQEAEVVYEVRELSAAKLTLAHVKEYELAIDTRHPSAAPFEYKASEHADKRYIRKTGITIKTEDISSYSKAATK